MKFEKKCSSKDCEGHNCCLVKVALATEKNPAFDLIGWLCPRCGGLQIEDGISGEIVENISNLKMQFLLHNNSVLTGEIAYMDIASGVISIEGERGEQIEETLPKGLEILLPFYKNGIPRGKVFSADISLEKGTIGGLKPHLFLEIRGLLEIQMYSAAVLLKTGFMPDFSDGLDFCCFTCVFNHKSFFFNFFSQFIGFFPIFFFSRFFPLSG